MSRFRMHYKEKPYRLLGTAWHSETQEPLALYECLYPNERGSLWVRPRDMFFEDVEVGGRKIGRFRDVPLDVEMFSDLDAVWGRLSPLLTATLGQADHEQIRARFARFALPSIFLASFEGDTVGFKIGYAREATYVSWLGGVRADRRRLGVGKGLLEAQHAWVRQRGFERIATKTLGTWPEMLALNLQNGFRITGCEPSARGVKVLMEKHLGSSPE